MLQLISDRIINACMHTCTYDWPSEICQIWVEILSVGIPFSPAPPVSVVDSPSSSGTPVTMEQHSQVAAVET